MSEKEKKNNPSEGLLQEIYKSVCMGTDSVTTILGRTKDAALRTELTAQLDGYQNFANITRNKLSALSVTAKEIGALAKIPAELSIMMGTMTDASPSKIAEMMIGGSTMGVIEMKKRIKQAQSNGAEQDAVQIANDVVAFEEENINKMKQFL